MASKAEVEIVNVSPAKAAEWLMRNTHNRPIRRQHIATLLRAIEKNEWRLGNDAIAFDSNGVLLNGQHRLTAIVESGKTLPVMVVRGLDPKAQFAMDTGKKRAAHEQFSFLGIQGGGSKAALCRGLLNYDDKDGLATGSNVYVTTEEIIDLCRGDELLDVAMTFSNGLSRRIPGGRTTAVALGYYLILNAWPEKVPAFHEQLADGVELTKNSPILRLRNLLLSGQMKQNTGVDRRKLLACFLKAFNLWIDGAEVEVLAWKSSDNWPAPFTSASYRRLLTSRERGEKSWSTRRLKEASS